MPGVTGFNHFSAAVSDMDAALGFWRDLLGLELLGRGVVEYDYLDQIVGLTGTRIEWASLLSRTLPGIVSEIAAALAPERPLNATHGVCLPESSRTIGRAALRA